MCYIIIESTQLTQILKNKLTEFKTQPVVRTLQIFDTNLINIPFISTFSLNETTSHYLMKTNEYTIHQPKLMKQLNYLEIYEILTRINLNAFFLWGKLFLITNILRLSFVFNAKYFSMHTDILENYSQLFVNLTAKFNSAYSTNLISLNLRLLFLKIINLIKLIKCFYRKPGNPYLRIRKIFPTVNIAFGFKISKYVLLLMNPVVLLMPLMFFS